MSRLTFAEFMTRTTGVIQLAVDTESEETKTLTVQFAVRDGDAVRVQVYYARGVRPPNPKWFSGPFVTVFGPHATRVIVGPAKLITADAAAAAKAAKPAAESPEAKPTEESPADAKQESAKS